jgi:hypothetical protein
LLQTISPSPQTAGSLAAGYLPLTTVSRQTSLAAEASPQEQVASLVAEVAASLTTVMW